MEFLNLEIQVLASTEHSPTTLPSYAPRRQVFSTSLKAASGACTSIFLTNIFIVIFLVWRLRRDFLTSYSSRSRFRPTQPLPCLQTSGAFHLLDAGYNTGLQSFSASPVSGRRYPCWEPTLQTGGVPKGELVPGHKGSVLDPWVERSFLSWTGFSQARGLKKLSCTSFRYSLNCP